METNDGVRALQPEGAQLVLDDFHHVGVVAGIELDEDVVAARGDMALHNFGYLGNLFHDPVEVGGFFQVDAHEGTGIVAYLARFEHELGTFEHAYLEQALNALVDGSATHAALACHFQKRFTGITRY